MWFWIYIVVLSLFWLVWGGVTVHYLGRDLLDRELRRSYKIMFGIVILGGWVSNGWGLWYALQSPPPPCPVLTEVPESWN